ncbi:MAG TPA: hypothetical protein VGF67_23430 [Ktedonobacteraceae bacterium]
MFGTHTLTAVLLLLSRVRLRASGYTMGDWRSLTTALTRLWGCWSSWSKTNW